MRWDLERELLLQQPEVRVGAQGVGLVSNEGQNVY